MTVSTAVDYYYCRWIQTLAYILVQFSTLAVGLLLKSIHAIPIPYLQNIAARGKIDNGINMRIFPILAISSLPFLSCRANQKLSSDKVNVA